MKALITRKVGMTSTIAEDGVVTAITLLSASPNVITQVKTEETDGYTAVQLGIGTRKPQNVNKARAGHFKKANTAPKAELHEIRLENGDDTTQLTLGGGGISACDEGYGRFVLPWKFNFYGKSYSFSIKIE